MGGEGFNGEVWRARLRGPLLCPQPDMAMALEAAHGLDRQAPGLSARQTLSLKQRQIATRSLLVLTVLTLMMPELPGILTILVVPPAFVASSFSGCSCLPWLPVNGRMLRRIRARSPCCRSTRSLWR